MSKQQVVGPYIVQRVIGGGTTGKVKLGYHKETGDQVAIKIISKSAFDEKPNLQVKVRREIALMKVVKHPNILSLVDVFESSRHLYIVVEYAQRGELFDFIVERGNLVEDVAIDFFRQIVLAIEYLHSHGICHRDLKPENILLDRNNRIKVADFGFARWVRSSIAETSCGSPHYAAPEVIRGVPYDGKQADIWSMGVILYALLAGYLPFDDPSVRVLLHKVKKGAFEMPPDFPADIADMIRRMITVDPTKRITIDQLKAHPGFRRGLADGYVLPTPIPFNTYSSPIDIETVSTDMKNVLKQIGYTDEEELEEELRAPTNNMAKVFIAMLTEQLDLENLPWDQSSNSTENTLAAGGFMAAQKGIAAPDTGDIDPFHRHKAMKPTNSMDVASMSVARPFFSLEATPVTSVLKDVSTEVFGVSIWNVMAKVEETCTNFGFQYFHPDPVTVYMRSKDGQCYMSVTTDFMLSDELTVSLVLHKGPEEQFQSFKDTLFGAWSPLSGRL